MLRGIPVQNDRSALPLSRRVREAIRERIAAGDWKPGDLSPPESRPLHSFGVIHDQRGHFRLCHKTAVPVLAVLGALTFRTWTVSSDPKDWEV
jgi:hypothetical protein